MKSTNNSISRKRFINTCGSVIAGGSIAGVSAVLLGRAAKQRNRAETSDLRQTGENSISSPYRLTATFEVANDIEGFEQYGDKFVVATQNSIDIYNSSGNRLNGFAVSENPRDIAVDNSLVYVLYPTAVKVFNMEGESVCQWEACSNSSDYCSIAITDGAVYVTDAANKNICKYATDGNFVKFINSPNGFVIPSYTFGIVATDGILYCSNSGRHQVEMFTPDGEYIGSFGQPGAVAGRFCGCCNPVHLTKTQTGEIITSEKGKPRISCYGNDGQFHSILLDDNALGGGNKAYDVKVHGDKIFVAGKNAISTFRYDENRTTASCNGCNATCALRG